MPRLERLCGHPLYKREMQALEIYERGREFCRHGWDHLLDVARIAYILALEQQLDIPKDVVYGMAFIHDIGRAAQYRDGTDHALAGKRLAQQILPEAGYSSEEAGWICGAVAGHRSTQKTDGMQAEMMPKDPAWKLAEILYQADKLSRRCYDCPASGACYWPEDRKIQTIIY